MQEWELLQVHSCREGLIGVYWATQPMLKQCVPGEQGLGGGVCVCCELGVGKRERK